MRTVALLVLLLLVPACGGDKAVPAATNVETKTSAPGTPRGFSVRAVPDDGFSIAVPKEWRTLDTSQAIGAGAKEFERDNPQMKGLVESLARPNSPIRLIAVEPTAGGIATNLNVLISPLPRNVSYSEWTREETRQLETIHPKNVRKGPADLPAGRAYSLAYLAPLTLRGRLRDVSIHQWMLKRGSSLYVLTYTTDPAHESELEGTFLQSAQTFKLTT